MCLGAVGFSWSLVGLIFLVPFSFSVVFYCNWVVSRFCGGWEECHETGVNGMVGNTVI